MVFCLIFLTSAEPKYNTKPRLPFLKPKPSTGSAFCPVISKSMSYDYQKRGSLCSQEVYHTMNKLKHSLNAVQLTEFTRKERPQSPVPDDKGQDFTSAEAPHQVQSLLPQKNNIRVVSPNQLVIFPPEIPPEYHTYSKSTTPELKNKTPDIVELPVFTNYSKTNDNTKNTVSHCTDEYSDFAELKYLPKFYGTKGQISMAMEIAPDRPFTPVAITEPIIKPAPWVSLPIENENRPASPLVAALMTAPEKSYSSLPTFTYASELEPTPIDDPLKNCKKTISITDTPIQNVNYKPPEQINSTRLIGNNPVKYMHGYNNKTPAFKPIKNNKTLSQPILPNNINKANEHIIGLEFKPISSQCDKSLICGHLKSVESKSNNNEMFITHPINFKESEQFHPEYVNTTLNQEELINHSKHLQNTIKQQLLFLDDKLASNKSLGPGIKNKLSTFTPKTSTSNRPFLKQLLSDHCKDDASMSNKFASVVNNSQQNIHPNSVKLTKAIPFFSNSMSSFTSSSKFS